MPYDVSDFAREVIERSHTQPVLVDFWAEWCAPCRMLGPVLERLAGQSGGTWVLAKVNTERLTDIASAYAIRSIPAVKLFHRGNVIAEFAGAMPEYMIVQWLKQHLPGAHADALGKARGLEGEGRTDEARAIYEEILRSEAEHPEARTSLARIILFDDPARARSLVEGIDEPKYSDRIETILTLGRYLSHETTAETLPAGSTRDRYLRAIGQLRGKDFTSALETFIAIIREDRYYDDDGSRKACIAIFRYLGEEHAVTSAYRRDFSSALY